MAEDKTKAAEDKTVVAEVEGIPVCIDRAVLTDIDVLDLLGEIQADNILVLPRLMRTVFGDEQYEVIKKSLADDGYTSVVDMSRFFNKAFKALGEQAKN